MFLDLICNFFSLLTPAQYYICNEAIKPDEKRHIDAVQRMAGFALTRHLLKRRLHGQMRLIGKLFQATERGFQSIDLLREVDEMSLG